MNYDAVPQELKELNQWVLWRFSNTEAGKITKKPYQKTGKLAKSNDKSTWESIDKIRLHAKNFDGIGFVFAESGGIVGIDLDSCVGDKGVEDWALEIINTFQSYTEYSVSGKGIHIIFKGKIPDNSEKRKGQIEIYDKGRYFCMTGNVYNGMKEIKEYKKLPEFLKSIGFIKDNGKEHPQPNQSSPSLTNDQIIEIASNTQKSDTFKKLFFNGDCSDYLKADGTPNQSSGDMALVNILAFYTQDIGQIVSLMRQTPLWDEKWERKDYQTRTIGKAIREKTEFYKGTGVKPKEKKTESKPIAETKTDTIQGPARTEKAVEVKSFYLTDYGNAERLVHYYGDRIRYCEAMKSWFIWDSKRWKPDKTLEIERLAKDVVRRIYMEATFCDDEEERKKVSTHASRSESAMKIKAMVEVAKSEIEVVVEPEMLDRNGWLFNCQNGTVNLRTGKIQPFTKTDYITKISNINFDTNAECPRWDKFMMEIFLNDKSMVDYIKYSLGYSLTTSIEEQCFFLCYGGGENGKSKMLDTLRFMFGDYGQRVDATTFEDMKNKGQAREDIACLKETRFITSIETASDGRLAENLIKKMTGDSTIKARFLYQNSFEFEQTYKIWLATNHKPIIHGTDRGMWRRVRLIPFEYSVPPEKKDGKLYDKLIAESSGIFNWMIEGCLLWQGCGLDIVTPKRIKDATENYRAEMDTLGIFLDECCLMQKGYTVSVTKLHEKFMLWSNSKISRKVLNLHLEERGFKKDRFSGGYHWIGLGLLD